MDSEMLEVSGEFRVTLSLVLYKAKNHLHTSDGQRMGQNKYNGYYFITQDLKAIDNELPKITQ